MKVAVPGTVVLAVILAAAACGPPNQAVPAMTHEHYVAQVEAWRSKHEADYQRDWVSIAGLHFLDAGVHTVGRAATNDIVLDASVPETIGRLVVRNDEVVYEPEAHVTVEREGRVVSGPIALKEAGALPGPDVWIGEVRLVVHVSGERLSLRVRDPRGELARGFLGFSWFPIDPEYRVTGRFIPDPQSRRMQVMNTFGDVDTYPTEGVVEFTLHGQPLRIRPFTTRPNRFYIVFRDASAGDETYKTARFLYADLQADGTVMLDFNEAYNPPCAFNPYTTCPIPLPENVLPVKVLAGERAYPVEVTLPVQDRG
jgi:uncharacterized protein